MNIDKIRKQYLMLFGVLSIFVLYFFNKIVGYFFSLEEFNPTQFDLIMDGLKVELISHPFHLYFSSEAFIGSLIAIFILFLIVLRQFYSEKNYHYGKEYGSAYWGTDSDAKEFMKMKYDPNGVILTTEYNLSTDARYSNRNINILLVGGPGSKKSRGHIKPNILQQYGSHVVTDPKGTILPDLGNVLEEQKRLLSVFNVKDMTMSFRYNPFDYIESEEDILTFANTLIMNTTNPDERSGDPFWPAAEKNLYTALISYIMQHTPKEEHNINSLLYLLRYIEIDDDNSKSEVDILFEDARIENEEDFCVLQYDKFRVAAGDTIKSILATTGARLSPFDIPRVKDLMSKDELHLDLLGKKPSVLFIISNDTDPTFNFLVTLLETQIIQVLCRQADRNVPSGKLSIPVHLQFDEFANIGKIPNFEQTITTIRSRNIFCTISIQFINQLRFNYKECYNTIIGACDTFLFLGGTDPETNKLVVERCGKETVHVENSNVSYGTNRNYSVNQQTIGKDLILQDEVAKLARDKCILMVAGCQPFMSYKYDMTMHPLYKKTAEYDEKNTYILDANKIRELAKKIELAVTN